VGNWTAPYVLQTAGTFTNGNFSVTAKIQVQSWGASAGSFDDCGILVRDASNIVCCGLYRSSSTNFSATRDATGSSFAEVDLGAFASNPAPYWIRITRTGTTTFQGWYSLNGTNFIQISTDMTTANFTPTGTGMYVGSTHLNGAVNTVKFDYFMETNTGDFTANEDSGGTGPVGSRRVFIIT
jgi:regulation of enolase protein 1 (concanavalin A-like superfamily)